MEGGMRISEALAWIRGKSAESVLDLAISLEANSYDLYLKMVRHLQDNRAKGVFEKLSAEEKTHIKRLAAVLDRKA
jgi:rubrerythrin